MIIPTYNEKENVVAIIQAVLALEGDYHVLIIEQQTICPNKLFLEERRGKLGLGTAYIHGFKWAISRNYDYIFEMDADFSHPPADLPRLFEACHSGGADVAVGSRYVQGGGVKNWPTNRILLSRGASIYTRLITFLPVEDTTAGFVCYKRKVLQAIDLDKIQFVGYAFQIEMKFAAWTLGFKIKEVPIVFEDRKLGESKMSKGIIKEGVLGVLKLRWYSLFKNYRSRVANAYT